MPDPHDLIPAILREFADDPHRMAPNLERPTRTELMAELATVRADLTRLWISADDYLEAQEAYNKAGAAALDSVTSTQEDALLDAMASASAHETACKSALDATLRSIDCNPEVTRAAKDATK